jgi:multidrug transporter EmrE-like cation transporter
LDKSKVPKMFGIDTNFIYLICLCIVEIFGDFTLERYTRTWNILDLASGSGWYVGVVFFLVKSLTGSNILYVNGMWDSMSCLTESICAYVFLGERFTDPFQYVGLGLTIVGIFLLKNKTLSG